MENLVWNTMIVDTWKNFSDLDDEMESSDKNK